MKHVNRNATKRVDFPAGMNYEVNFSLIDTVITTQGYKTTQKNQTTKKRPNLNIEKLTFEKLRKKFRPFICGCPVHWCGLDLS